MQINKMIALYILLAGLVLSCRTNMDLAETSQQRIENVRFSQEDNMVTIHYDLHADKEDARFNVQLLLDLENDQVIDINSESVTGDIGSDVSPGTGNKITWDVLQDFPRGLESDQIQFTINAWKDGRNNRRWIYVAAGALALGAGISAGIILNGGGGESSGLPPPPSRPGS